MEETQNKPTRVAPKRVATAVLNSLKGGVVPRVGLEYVTVGRSREIEALLRDTEIIAEGGAAFRFLTGAYGSGKSFLLQTIRNHVMEKGFVVLDCDLSPERRFSGTKGQGLATYKELIRNMATRTRPEGGALPLVLERWLSALQSETAAETGLSPGEADFEAALNRKIFAVVNAMEDMVNGFDFGQALNQYRRAVVNGDDDKKSAVLRWFRGEYSTKSEARQALGIHLTVNDENWYDFLKLFSAFLVRAGYKGMLLMVDELVNLYRIPHKVTRQYNYEKILMMYNDTLQGKAKHIGVLMCATPQCLEDSDKGIFSYDALRSRLTQGRFSLPGSPDLLAPIIRLEPLQYEELMVLCEKLCALHEGLYGYEAEIAPEAYVAFLKAEFERVGAATHITPREIIRDFIELLNILWQNPGERLENILAKGGFAFAAPEVEDALGAERAMQAEFAAFEV
ncbi:MAG: ATP-binding protein [Oscillospiraceae bacterium]|nr:ATP-binding protein [Oscillospiraceae bacterium]